MPVGVGNQRNGFGDVFDFPGCKEWLHCIDEGDGIAAGDIRREYNDEFLPRDTIQEAYVLDPAARDGGSNRSSIKTVVHLQVVDEYGLTGDFGCRLYALESLSDGPNHTSLPEGSKLS